MFLGEAILKPVIEAGLRDLVTLPLLVPSAYAPLPDVERQAVLEWFRNTKIMVTPSYSHQQPTLPLIAIRPDASQEADPPVGSLGVVTLDTDTGESITLSGSWFSLSYQFHCMGSGANTTRYLTTAVTSTLLRARDFLTNEGLTAQKISISPLDPAEEFTDPAPEVFRQIVTLQGTAFLGTPDSDGVVAVTNFTLSTDATEQALAFGAQVLDTFDRSDNTETLGLTNTGQRYAALSGKFGLRSGEGYMALAGGVGKNAAVVDLGVASTEMAWTLGANPLGARAVFRASDIDNGYVVEAAAGSFQLKRLQAGAFTTIATYTRVPLAADVVTVVAAGSTIALFVNGALGAYVSSAFNKQATLAGVGGTDTFAGSFARFSV